MDYLDILINRVEIMFLIIILGFILRKINFIDDSITTTMGDIMLKVITPLTIFVSFITEYSLEKVKVLGICLLVSLALHIINITYSFITFGKKYPLETFASLMGNVGFFGIAVALSVCGSEAAFYAAPFVAINALTMWTFGDYVMSNGKAQINFKNIITNFNVLAFLLGLVFFFLRINIPQVFKDTISSLSNINSPVCGLIIGVGLAKTKFENPIKDISSIFAIISRLVIIPILSVLALKFISNDLFTMKFVYLILSSVPCASAATIFSYAYKQDIGKASRIISLSTLLCVVSMPLITKLAYVIWGI